MKLVNYDCDLGRGFDLPTESFEEAERMIKSIERKLTKKYGILDFGVKCGVQEKLAVLITSVGQLDGKTILDIGCGSKNSWDYGGTLFAGKDRLYDPWLCRVAHELGAKVFGIDGASSPGEEYTHIQENLLNFEEVMERFEDNSINLACAWSFFDSPNLADGRTMFKRIVRGLEQKVKPEGVFIFEAIGTGTFHKPDWEKYLASREKTQ